MYSETFILSLQLVKLCSGMIEAGKAYVSANKLFVSGIRDLSQQCKKDEMISVRFWWLNSAVSEIFTTFFKCGLCSYVPFVSVFKKQYKWDY